MDTATPSLTPPRPPARWTVDEESRLAEAFRNGDTPQAIAALLGRSVGAVESRLLQLGLLSYGDYDALVDDSHVESSAHESRSGSPWTEPDIAALLAAHHGADTPELRTESLKIAAAALGRSPRSLVLKLVQLGALQPTRNPNPTRKIAVPKPAKAKPALAPTPTAPTKTVKITVTPEFQTALASVLDGENMLVLGSAGTGKSTFLKWLRAQVKGKKRMAVLAPTGMAALNVGGQTLHSFFGFKPRLMNGSSDDWHKPRNPKIYESLQLIVIDEISMVRADIFESIDRFLRKYGPIPRTPFGGVQLLLMGDLCQLPPVVRREEETYFEDTYGTPFFFSTPSWREGNFGVVPFTHIFRQTDKPFIDLLNAIRMGSPGQGVLSALNARVTPPPQGTVVLAARNRTVDALNAEAMAALTGPEWVFRADVVGDIDPSNVTTPAELVLKRGARVMFTRNDSVAQRWVNGTLGTVETCHAESVHVRLDDGTVHVVERVKWEATKYKLDASSEAPVATVAGTFTQIPLVPAWALTIHKAQGQTLPQCVIDLGDGGTFAEGQLYVALSRARSLDSLYLTQPIQPRHVKTHPAVQDFYSDLAAHSGKGA